MKTLKVEIVYRDDEGDKQKKTIEIGKAAYEGFMKDEHPYYKGSKILEEFESEESTSASSPESAKGIAKEVHELVVSEKEDRIAQLEKELEDLKKKKTDAAKPTKPANETESSQQVKPAPKDASEE